MIRLNDKAIAVEVPHWAYEWRVSKGSIRFISRTENSASSTPIEPGFKPLGLAHELNEEQCAEVVDIIFDTPRMYKDYMAPTPFGTDRPGMTAKESFRSLMESHGLDMKVKTCLILIQA